MPEHENEETTIRSQLWKGDRPGEGAERSETASPPGLPEGRARRRPATLGESREPMDKNPAMAGPTRRVEVAQHTEGDWYARGGKCGGSAVEQRVITWGDLSGESR